jgi:predicted nuclease of predicted toxin-antitoxin system
MRLLTDENVPRPSVRLLRESGYEVDSMTELAPGTPDTEVLARAQSAGQVLITFDRDFGELVYHRGAPAPLGIIYLRVEPADAEEPARLLLSLFTGEDIQWVGRFTVVDRERVRQRPLLSVS